MHWKKKKKAWSSSNTELNKLTSWKNKIEYKWNISFTACFIWAPLIHSPDCLSTVWIGRMSLARCHRLRLHSWIYFFYCLKNPWQTKPFYINGVCYCCCCNVCQISSSHWCCLWTDSVHVSAFCWFVFWHFKSQMFDSHLTEEPLFSELTFSSDSFNVYTLSSYTSSHHVFIYF